MRLLLLPAYFAPEQTASSHLDDHRLQAFADAGIEMVAYAPWPTRSVPSDALPVSNNELLYDGKLSLHRFHLMGESRHTLLRGVRYFLQTIKHFNRAVFCKEARSCNLMYTGSTPPIQGAMAAMVKKITKLPHVYNVQDMFPDSLVGSGMATKKGILWKIGRAIEDFTYKNADKIIVISEDFKKNLLAKGVPEDKIVVIYNWVDENAVVDIPREENKLIIKYNLDPNKFYITYSGNIGLTQNMDMLLSVMQELLDEEPEIRLVLIGEGAYKEQVKKIIGERKLTNVSVLPFQPYEDISHVFNLGNAGLVISKPGVGANSVPSKTWSIMSASRPVLANFDANELKSIINNNHCGIFTLAGDKKAFKESILELYHNPDLCRSLGNNGRDFIIHYLTKSVGTKKYVDVIKSFEVISGE